MKYAQDKYETAIYFRRYSRSDFKREQKLVSSRFDHKCVLCSTTIHRRDRCLCIKELISGSGWIRGWICIDCCNRWISATHQE